MEILVAEISQGVVCIPMDAALPKVMVPASITFQVRNLLGPVVLPCHR